MAVRNELSLGKLHIQQNADVEGTGSKLLTNVDANHTGTLTTEDIEILTGSVITIPDAPVAGTDGANKAYVDAQVSGVSTPASVSQWHKYTVGYAALSAAALTFNATLFSLPAGGIIEAVKIRHTTAFAGGSVSAMTISVGLAGELDKYASAFNVFQAVSATTFQVSAVEDGEDHGGTVAVKVAATAVGDNLDQLTVGSVDIWVRYAVAV